MNKTLTPICIEDNQKDYTFYYESSKKCPLCNTGIEPKILSAFSITKSSGKLVSILFFCPHCDMCFLGVYRTETYANTDSLYLIGLIPRGNPVTGISNNISEISPKFVEIYHQAEKAEQWGLNEICGLGYRKALEFLVKDYAITCHPDNVNEIKKQPLAPCINKYIDNPKIKNLSKASAWLGNDEAHYSRKHEDYNIQHIKAFISAILTYIEAELSYIKAENLLKS